MDVIKPTSGESFKDRSALVLVGSSPTSDFDSGWLHDYTIIPSVLFAIMILTSTLCGLTMQAHVAKAMSNCFGVLLQICYIR